MSDQSTNDKLYLATKNSDSTEGKGSELSIGLFSNLATAVECVKGLGVMGTGDGSVYEVPVNRESPDELSKDRSVRWKLRMPKTLVYGYRKDPLGRWGYGYVDNRELSDPDVIEFLRLARKLGVKLT